MYKLLSIFFLSSYVFFVYTMDEEPKTKYRSVYISQMLGVNYAFFLPDEFGEGRLLTQDEKNLLFSLPRNGNLKKSTEKNIDDNQQSRNEKSSNIINCNQHSQESKDEKKVSNPSTTNHLSIKKPEDC